tara:strand:- start:614 stop:934 length:321 start_codon:yes stop_codon:yes gene_type:complete
MPVKFQESAGVSFSLSFLIQVLTAIVLGVWAYSQFDARISMLENSSSSHGIQITLIQDGMIESQDRPISSDHIQNTKLFFLEEQVAQQQSRIATLEERIYRLNVTQ